MPPSPAGQAIAFAPLPDVDWGAPPFELTATATSGLPVSYTALGLCSISGSTLTITGVGSCSVTASQAGDTNWAPADDVTVSFAIILDHPLAQTVSFGLLPDVVLGSPPIELAATSSSGLGVAYLAEGNCVVTGTTVTVGGSGTCTVTASQPGNELWLPADAVTRSFDAAEIPATATYSVEVPGSAQWFDTGIDLAAGSEVIIWASGRVRIAGSDVDGFGPEGPAGCRGGNPGCLAPNAIPAGPYAAPGLIGSSLVGRIAIGGQPFQVGGFARFESSAGRLYLSMNDTYFGDNSGSFLVQIAFERSPQTITFDPLPKTSLGSSPIVLTGTASSGLPVAYSASGVCSVRGAVLTLTGEGLCSVTAHQPGNSLFEPAVDVARAIRVGNSGIVSAWPMVSHDQFHTGRTTATGPESPVIRWRFAPVTPGVATVFTWPIVGAGGVIWAACNNGIMYGLSPLDGAVLYQYRAVGDTYPDRAGAIGPDGELYLGESHAAWTWGAQGMVRVFGYPETFWYQSTLDIGGYNIPTIVNGTVYVGGTRTANALDALTGALRWSTPLNGMVAMPPAVGSDGTVYFTDDGWQNIGPQLGSVYALDPATGAIRWRFQAAGQVNAAPAVAGDGTVYIGTGDGYLIALDGATGSVRWRHQLAGAMGMGSPAIGVDGTVYALGGGALDAVDPSTGDQLWRYATGGLTSAPAIDANGTVYAVGYEASTGYAYAIRGTDGSLLWKLDLGYSVGNSSIAIGGDGTLYVGAGAGSTAQPYALVAIGDGGSAQPQTISFQSLPDATYGAAPIDLDATASSGLPVGYTTSGPCIVEGWSLRLTGAGTCAVMASQPGDDRWAAASSVTRSFTIGRALLRVTADDASMVEHGVVPELGYSFDGFVNGDGAGSLVSLPSCVTTADASSLPGDYPISCTGAAAANYVIEYVSGTFTIAPRVNHAPTASLTMTVLAGVAPLDVGATLAGTDADGDTLTFSLDFGDGTAPEVGSLPVATLAHRYATPGTYTARLAVTDGTATAIDTGAVTVAAAEALTAVAGDDVSTVAGVAVTFDGSGSRPLAGITSYRWSFGDGTPEESGPRIAHTFTEPGTYSVVLEVAQGMATATASVTATVRPAAGSMGVAVTVHDPGLQAIPGADVAVVDATGNRYSATADGGGVARLFGLADGAYTAYGWHEGFQPAITSVVVSAGSGSAELILEPGQIAQTAMSATPLTKDQAQAAGIDTNDPANQNVYQFEIHLALTNEPTEQVTFSGYTTSGNGFVEPTFSGGTPAPGGGSGGNGGTIGRTIGGFTAYPSLHYVGTRPTVLWMVVPERARWLKEFFEVRLLVTNLAAPGFTFQHGLGSLGDLPAGLSLAPTSEPQSLVQPMRDVPGGSSESVEWVIRGDAEGLYTLSARYAATLEPVGAAISLAARTPDDALHVWGSSAIEMIVDADDVATIGYPYLVRVGLKNVADVPVYNAAVELRETGRVGYIYQPRERAAYSTTEIAPGATFWTGYYRLIPEIAGTLDLSRSFAKLTPAGADLTSTIVQHPATPIVDVPQLSVTAATDGNHLDWQPVPAATGYEIYWTPTRDTAFGTVAIATLRGDQHDAVVSQTSGFVAVSSIVAGTHVLHHPLRSLGPRRVNVSMVDGPWYGGNKITITGSSLRNAMVTIGGVAAAVTPSDSDAELEVTVPPRTIPRDRGDEVDVEVRAGSSVVATGRYTYRGVVVVALRGWTTSLTTGDTAWPRTADSFQSYLVGQGWPAEAFTIFSYAPGATTFGQSYVSCDTFEHLTTFEAALDAQLAQWEQTHPDVDAYLVGHSQGGAVAFGYLAWLRATGRVDFVPTTDVHVAGVVTMDSPLGGFASVENIYASVMGVTCARSSDNFADYRSLAGSRPASPNWPWGGLASFETVFGAASPINNDALAGEAARFGVRVLSIGNDLDAAYTFAGNHSSQWLSDGVAASHVYSRNVSLVSQCDITDVACRVNHGAVLSDPANGYSTFVNAAIADVLSGQDAVLNQVLPAATPPFAASASGTIPAAGGTLRLQGGFASLTVPAGTPSEATLNPVGAPALGSLPAGALQAGPAFQSSSTDLFVAGRTARYSSIYYGSALPPGSAVVLYRFEPAEQQPLSVSQSQSGRSTVQDEGPPGGRYVPLRTTFDEKTGEVSAEIAADGIYVPLAIVPTVSAPVSQTAAGDLEFEIRFATPVSPLASTDLIVLGTSTGCVVGVPASSDQTSFTVIVSECTTGTVALRLAAGAVMDEAGNVVPATDVASAPITFLPVAQTISFGALADVTFGTTPLSLAAGASSGLPVEYAAEGSCVESNALLTLVATGECTVTATQPGNARFAAAPAVSRSFMIERASLTITASSATMTYGGTVPTIEPEYAGFVAGDTAASLTAAPTCVTEAGPTSPVGEYASRCTAADSPNYTISYAPGAVSVERASLTITASSATMTYGGTVPTIEPEYAGFVAGDTAASLTAAPTCVTEAGPTSPVGEYASRCTAADSPNYAISYAPGRVVVVPGPLAGLLLTTTTPSWTAGMADSITVTAVDAYGNRITNYAGTIHFTSTDAKAALPADFTFSSADNGTHSFSVGFKKAGAQTVRARDTVASIVTGTVRLAVAPGPLAALRLETTNQTWTAGAAAAVTVVAVDAFGNSVPSYRGAIHFTSTDARGSLPSDYAFAESDAGRHSFAVTLKTATVQTMRARDMAVASVTGTLRVTVRVGAVSALALSTIRSSWTAGAPDAIAVTAVDAYGNTVTTYRGRAHFTSTDPRALLPSDYVFTTEDAGRHVFGVTFRTAGIQVVRSRDTVSTSVTGTVRVSVIPASLTALSLSATSSSWTQGTPGSFTVTAVDAFGNRVSSYQGTVHFTSTDSKAGLPADYAFVAVDAGRHVFGATLGAAGTQVIRGRDTASSTVTGTLRVTVSERQSPAPHLRLGTRSFD